MRSPNILLITSDQQHWSTLGCIHPVLQTPALDRMAAEGVRFNRAYCPNPTCSPTRASLITGMYPSTHGCWAIGVKLPEDVPTVGETFLRNGYDTVLVGKAHFQPLKSLPGSESVECQPLLRDLDYWRNFDARGPWYGFNRVETARMHAHESHVGQHYALWLEEKGLRNWADYFEPYPRVPGHKYEGPYYSRDSLTWDLPEELHHSHWIAERTVAHIERCAREGRPFFLWSSFFDPHPPYVVPEPWASMYDPASLELPERNDDDFRGMPPHFLKTREENPDYSIYAEPGGQGLHGCHSHRHTREELLRSTASYYGMISLMDRCIGRIMEALDRNGMAEETLVVFTSDHGHFIGQHGLIAKGPFHYEDVLRVPMIVRWPGAVPAGRVSESLQSLVDYAPSFLSAAGIRVPGAMQGLDQTGVWTGEVETIRDQVLVENRHNPTRMDLRTLVMGRYKITVYRDAEYGELFDLEADPGENVNLWDDPASAEIKLRLLHRFVRAEIEREPTRMPRIAGA